MAVFPDGRGLSTAFVLASIGEIGLMGETTRIVFEEGVGPVPVAIRAENGKPVFCQSALVSEGTMDIPG